MAINTTFQSNLQDLPVAVKPFVQQLKRPAVIGLYGPMGAGKTTFVRACCQAMQTTDWVNSPTYSIIQTYQTPFGDVLHVDLYRCQSDVEIDLLDIPSCMGPRTVAFIEWIENATLIQPDITVSIEVESGDNRRFTIEGVA